MARRRIPIGQHGEIRFERPTSQASGNNPHRARCSVRDFDGVLREVSASGPSREAARHALLEDIRLRFETTAGAGADGITPDTRIRVLVDEWLEECRTRNLSTSTMRIYESSARLYIKPYMGEWLIREAKTARVDRVIKEHIAAGLDHKALRKHLNQLFDVAIRHDALATNPVDAVAKVNAKRSGGRKVKSIETAAQVAEIRAIITAWQTKDRPGPKATDDLFLFVMLLVVTGLRPGELLALRWSDVNLSAPRPYLEVTGTIKQEKGLGVYRQEYPKSESSERPVEIPGSLVAMLLERQVNQSGPNPIDAVFPSRVGSWIPYSNMRRRWVSAVTGTKYAWVTFKTFRKAVAKLLTEQYDLRTAQEQLGHASQTTTETFYVGLNTEAPKVAETLERFFKESTPSSKTG
jgi:integrase